MARVHISCIVSNRIMLSLFFFFFNDTATTEIYTLSLHDALPISDWFIASYRSKLGRLEKKRGEFTCMRLQLPAGPRSEEHTSELQSPCNLVCRLLLEKKKTSTNLRAPTKYLRADSTYLRTILFHN